MKKVYLIDIKEVEVDGAVQQIKHYCEPVWGTLWGQYGDKRLIKEPKNGSCYELIEVLFPDEKIVGVQKHHIDSVHRFMKDMRRRAEEYADYRYQMGFQEGKYFKEKKNKSKQSV